MTVGRPTPVVALAGHVDHGKSTLVADLTGGRTDRRPDEARRGLTVDLAHHVLDGGVGGPVALVDVPGHVDYLGNTLAGMAGGTHALLVVAADDGWMPQTVDHAAALAHLGLPLAAVALSRADRVDEERLAAVRAAVVATTGVAADRVVATSMAGRGRAAIADLLRALAVAASDRTAPDLWVDRAFDVPGHGRVATGTLRRGRLAVGDRVRVAPAGTAARVRALQQHGRPVDQVVAPARVAVGLVGVRGARGDRLLDVAVPEATGTDVLDVRLVPAPEATVGGRGAWLLHLGTTRVEARLRPLVDDPLPTAGGVVRCRLARPVGALAGDPVVLVDASDRRVVGGGRVLDPRPPAHRAGRAGRRDRATALDRVDAGDPTPGLVHADGGVTPVRLAATRLGAPVGGVAVADHLVAPTTRAAIVEAALAVLAVDGPRGRPGPVVVAAVADRCGVPPAVVAAILADTDAVRRRDDLLVTASAAPDLDADRTAAAARLRERLRIDPLRPPPLASAARDAGVTAEDLERLVRRGAVLVAGAYGVLPGAVEVMVARLRVLEQEAGPFTVAGARDALGVTRRHAVPWLELLDRLGHTTREGDWRRVTAP